MVTRIATSVLVGAVLSACAVAQAAVMSPITADLGSASTNASASSGPGNGVADGGRDNIAVGHGAAGEFRGVVFAFKLPTLPAGETVTSAQFSADYWTPQGDVSGWGVNASAVRVAPTAAVAASDYGQWTGGVYSNGTKLQSDFVTGATAGSYGSLNVSLDSTAQSTLGSYLAGNYAAGSYVFISLNANAIIPDAQIGKRLFFTSNKADGSIVFAPELTLTTVPEPASLGLLGLSVVGLLGRRQAR